MAREAAGICVGTDAGVGESGNGKSPARPPALHDAVKRVSRTWYKCTRESGRGAVPIVNAWCVARLEVALVEIEGMQILLAVSAKETDTQTEIQRELLRDPPIILEIRFDDFVAVVIFGLEIRLLVLSDVPHQQIGIGISGADICVARVEGKDSLNVRRVVLVLLGKNQISAKGQGMLPENLRHIVAVRVR